MERLRQPVAVAGEDVLPPLRWTNVPEGTRSLALVVDDPDAPGGVFTYWTAGDSIREQAGWVRASGRRARARTTSARAATAAPARLRAPGASAMSSACTPSAWSS